MTRRSLAPLPVLGGLLAIYLIVPVVAFVFRLVDSHQRGFGVPGLGDALVVSLVSATISLGLIALFGIPLAYGLARHSGRISSTIGLLAQLPLALPPLVGGILLVYIVGPYSALGRLFHGQLTETLVGVVLAQVFVAAPFLIAIARAAFRDIDPALLDVAATLGLGETARFFRVALPAANEGIRAGLLLAWLRAFGEYGATSVLAYHPYTLSVFTYLQFSGTGLPNTEAPTALALISAAVVLGLVRVRIHLPRRPLPFFTAAANPRVASELPVSFALDINVGDFHLELAHAAKSARLAILGPSGSGKSLTLRCLAGVLESRSNAIAFGNRDVSRVRTEHRGIGYVPQGLSLLPGRRVGQQVIAGVGADPALAVYWLNRLHITQLVDRLPHELSGGERQRVCLAQALTRSPDLLLLDEPFSALDAPVRAELRRAMRELQREFGLSTVLVTHDPEEAAMLADEILVIAGGRLLQAGPRRDVFSQPASPEVARLLGASNILSGELVDTARLRVGHLEFACHTEDVPNGPVIWSVRPEYVRISSTGALRARVRDVIELANTTELVLEIGLDLFLLVHTGMMSVVAGDECAFDIPSEWLLVWPDGDRAQAEPV